MPACGYRHNSLVNGTLPPAMELQNNSTNNFMKASVLTVLRTDGCVEEQDIRPKDVH